jgi:hypothetical protein
MSSANLPSAGVRALVLGAILLLALPVFSGAELGLMPPRRVRR